MNAILQAIERFNEAATELQKGEFRRARSPAERERLARNGAPRDYARVFDAVVPFLQAFEAMNSDQRTGIGKKLNPDALGILRTFASSMPILAVRQNSPGFIAQGLTALAVLGDVDDARDLCFYLATTYHLATKLGIDSRKVFGDAAALVTPGYFQDMMRSFPLRQPKDRELSAFRIREVHTAEGYDLVQDPL